MIIAEFYIDHRLDPLDPNHMDNFLAGLRDDGDDDNRQPSVEVTGLVLIKNDAKAKEALASTDDSSSGRFVLDEKKVKLTNLNEYSVLVKKNAKEKDATPSDNRVLDEKKT